MKKVQKLPATEAIHAIRASAARALEVNAAAARHSELDDAAQDAVSGASAAPIIIGLIYRPEL